MDIQFKYAVLRLNEDIQSRMDSNPASLGRVRIPPVLQERFGFPRTLSELSVEQCVQIALMTDVNAFEEYKRAKALWQFRRLRSKQQIKH